MKQTLRSSGANVTATHIEDVSLSTLFLLEAAKKTGILSSSLVQELETETEEVDLDYELYDGM